MERIKDYIMNGKGWGFKFIVILALFMALFFANSVKNAGEFMIPHFQAAADALFPIKIENGVVTEPAETIKSYSVNFDDGVIKAIIDTTVDDINAAGLPFGIYLARKNMYVVAPDKVTTYPLSGNLYFRAGDYRSQMLNAVVWMAIVSSVMMFFIYLLLYSLWIWVFSWTARVVAIVFNREVTREVEKRLSMVCVVMAVLVALGLEYLGVYGFWPFALLVVLLELWLFYLLQQSYHMPQRKRKKLERI